MLARQEFAGGHEYDATKKAIIFTIMQTKKIYVVIVIKVLLLAFMLKVSEWKFKLARPVGGCCAHLGEELMSSGSASIAPGEQTCGELSFVARSPDTGFLAHIAERFAATGVRKWQRIIVEARQLKTELTMSQEADYNGLFNAREVM